MVRFENRVWAASALAFAACGPGINVDPPDTTSAPDTQSTARDASPVSPPVPTHDTDAGLPAASSGETSTGPALDPSASAQPIPPMDAGVMTAPEVSQPAPTQSDPSGNEGVVPPPTASATSECTEPPRIVSQQNCHLSVERNDSDLSLDLSADLQLYAWEILWATVVGDKPDFLNVSFGVTSSKHLELQVDWTQPVTFDVVRIQIARMDDRCPVIEIPVTFTIMGTENECVSVEELR